MTEKRYVRIVDHLEKEVQIFDTINEKKIFNIFFNELDSAICLNGALTDVVDLLNELHEENQLLKQRLAEQNDVEWLRNNTVWTTMPTSRRTYTTTSVSDKEKEQKMFLVDMEKQRKMFR